MTLPPLPDDAVVIGLLAETWHDAVLGAGDALHHSGATQSGYGARMVDVVEEFGAYIVIAPGLALAHAGPGSDVVGAGLSLVTLAEPVAFGHPHNDPVRVVVGLAAVSADEHVAAVAALANVFNDEAVVAGLATASDAASARRLLGAMSANPKTRST